MDHDQEHLPPDSPLMTMSHSFLHDEMLKLSIPGPSRDPTYYIGDGNTVLLVDNTLFKVHRSILMKDKSAFETMFQLSTEADSARSDCSTTVTEGESDDNPIRLQGDTGDEFRALLWALYALPHELMSATSSDANCTMLVNLARVAHKYQFRSIETWVLSAVHNYYSRPGAFDPVPTTTPPTLPPAAPANAPPSLEQLTELAALCERSDLLDLAIARWKKQIGEGKDLALAIIIGERLSLRPIVGLAYHAMMLKGRAHWETESTLSRDQRVRLLSGYYALTKMWEALPGQPPPLSHTVRCTSNQRCNKAFGQLWKAVLEGGSDILPGLQREDVLTKLMLAESTIKVLLENNGHVLLGQPVDGLPTCKESALVVTAFKVREFKDSLTDYFMDDV
ncbi:uncharacterized protein B0H18DRAFT_972097 [Fomitopsis serialis]|uniref:uncharacterized protein n=1 Tax=Fomitopsis serialis TaxID=139415 RepID=UPI00200753DF|nr:uncharacterized protein B0H18DRAFT_972097 [Neoantrodia serialis]KAH9936087.1 hypothetical protein B0H18DRAFT_972097 [Neoantrodia serialis]